MLKETTFGWQNHILMNPKDLLQVRLELTTPAFLIALSISTVR